MSRPKSSDQRISKADIEAKLAEISGEVDEQVANTKQLAITVGAVVVGVILAGFFLAGRRRGKKLSTVVEIRRL